MKLSVIIPTCERRSELERLLASLTPEKQCLKESEYEIIISFDGGEIEFTPPTEIKAIIKNTSGEKAGPAATRNRGASIASGGLLVFLDDDCVAEKKCLKEYLDNFDKKERAIFEGRTSALGERKSLAESAPINENGGMLWSCNFAIPKSIFEELSGFDARFKYPAMEDLELKARIEKLGIPITFLKNAQVYHPFRIRGSREYFEKHFESSLLFENLHPDKKLTAFGHFRMAIHGLLFDTLPGIFAYKGKGSLTALRVHVHMVIAGLRKLKSSVK